MIYRTSNLDVQIRPYEHGDLNHILNVDLKSYELNWPSDKWLKHIEDTHVAELSENGNKRIIGFWVADLTRNIIRLLKLAVTPRYRRNKVASCLLHDLVNHYSDAEYITALVGDSQKAAQDFLNMQGFTHNTEIDDYPVIGGGEKGFYLQARINR